MQKTLPMHLNTSPACFEGSGTGKQEKRHNTLTNLKLAPKKKTRYMDSIEYIYIYMCQVRGPPPPRKVMVLPCGWGGVGARVHGPRPLWVGWGECPSLSNFTTKQNKTSECWSRQCVETFAFCLAARHLRLCRRYPDLHAFGPWLRKRKT